MESLLVLLLVAAGIGLCWFVVKAILRERYVRQLEARGWRIVDEPDIELTVGLNVPPFGVHFGHKIRDHVSGKSTGGEPFDAFRYSTAEWEPSSYVVTMALPHSFPPAAATGPDGPGGSIGAEIELGQLRASSPVPGLARQLAAALEGRLSGPYRVTLDHERIVLVGAGIAAAELAAAVEQLAELRAAVLASPIAQLTGPTAPQHLAFFSRPDWTYLPRDDSFLDRISHSEGGFEHRAEDIVFASNEGLPFLRLTHRWKTKTTTMDGNGNSRTVIHHHEEHLCQFRTSFPFRRITLDWELFGERRKFEWEEFNKRFKIRSDDAKFAHDVINQRQMDYLMRVNAPAFEITGNGYINLRGSDWSLAEMEAADTYLRGFFARVPDFVWQDLGAWPRPIPEVEG